MLDYPKIIVWPYLGKNSKIMSKTESDLAEFRENLDLDQEKHESIDSYETEDEVPVAFFKQLKIKYPWLVLFNLIFKLPFNMILLYEYYY